MGDKTGIQWTDATWNVGTGCTPISPGCDHCYAKTVAETRLRDRYLEQAPVVDAVGTRADPFAPRWWPDRLEQPLRWQRPRRIFVNSMSDVFHAHFTLEHHIAPLFDVMKRAHWHQFQVLTKRPERALRYADRLPWPANVWLGVSVESMPYAGRVDVLRSVPAAVRFVSAEPLLGPLDRINLSGIHWIIPGGESGRGARPCRLDWIRGIIERASIYGTKVFVKQLGGETDKRANPDAWPADIRVREYPQ
jgi:protein gp37